MNGEHKVGDGVASPPARRLIAEDEFIALLGVSRRSFKELQVAGTVPPPLSLGPRLARWEYPADFDEAIARMPRREQRVEPANLAQARRARIEALKAPVQATA